MTQHAEFPSYSQRQHPEHAENPQDSGTSSRADRPAGSSPPIACDLQGPLLWQQRRLLAPTNPRRGRCRPAPHRMRATQITMRAPSAAPKTSYLEILIILPDLLPPLGVAAPSPVDFIQPRPPARYPVDVSRIQLILPAFPKLRSCPPAGEGWQRELKFDG